MSFEAPRLPPGPLYGEPVKFRPAWVRLDLLFAPPTAGSDRLIVDGLDMTGEAPGFVHSWLRAGHGIWIARCTYEVRYVDGRDERFRAESQLVPAYALRPRQVPSGRDN